MNRRERKRLMREARKRGYPVPESNGHHPTDPADVPIVNPEIPAPVQPAADVAEETPPEIAHSILSYVRLQCEADTGDPHKWNSKGFVYRWELVKDEAGGIALDANGLPTVVCFRIASGGQHEIKSHTIRFDEAGKVKDGPKLFVMASKVIHFNHEATWAKRKEQAENPGREFAEAIRSGVPGGAVELTQAPPLVFTDREIGSLTTMLRVGLAATYAMGFNPDGETVSLAVRVCQKVESSLGVKIIPETIRDFINK